MPAKIEIKAGERFGRLTAIKEVEHGRRDRKFLCQCDCGNQKIVAFHGLRYGHTKSCGCYRKESLSNAYTTHGESKTRLYGVWTEMKRRCFKEKDKRYKYYGARGITVCDEWLQYEGFRDWALLNGYKKNLSIERINVDGNYTPANCTWITQAQQTRNMRSNVVLAIGGFAGCLSEVARHFGIKPGTLRSRLRRGVPLEIAIKAPVSSGGRPVRC